MAKPISGVTEDPKTKVYGSQETLDSLSPKTQEAISNWGGNVKGVLFISAEDLPEINIDDYPDTEEGFEQYRQARADVMEDIFKQYPEFDVPYEVGDPDRQLYMAGFYISVQNMFMGVRHDGPNSEYVVVQTEKRPGDISAEEWASRISGMKELDLHDVSGTAEDHLIHALKHEAFHTMDEELEQGAGVYEIPAEIAPVLEGEIRADIAASEAYKKEFEKGNVTTDQVIDDFQDMRAIAALRDPSHSFLRHINYSQTFYNDHSTSGGITLEGKNLIRNEFNASAIGSACINVNSLCAILVYEHEEKLAEQAGFELREVDKSDALRNKMMVGANEIARDPLSHYSAVKTLLDKGYFPEGTEEHEVATDFIKAFDEHVIPGLDEVDQKRLNEMLDNMDDIKPASKKLLKEIAGLDHEELISGVKEPGVDDDTRGILKTADRLMKLD